MSHIIPLLSLIHCTRQHMQCWSSATALWALQAEKSFNTAAAAAFFTSTFFSLLSHLKGWKSTVGLSKGLPKGSQENESNYWWWPKQPLEKKFRKTYLKRAKAAAPTEKKFCLTAMDCFNRHSCFVSGREPEAFKRALEAGSKGISDKKAGGHAVLSCLELRAHDQGMSAAEIQRLEPRWICTCTASLQPSFTL